MRTLLTLLIPLLLSSCDKKYDARKASERLISDLHRFSLSLPAQVDVLHGYRFGGRDLGDVFVVKADRDMIRHILESIRTTFSASKEFTLTIGTDISNAPYSFSKKSYSLRSCDWWTPWTLREPTVFYIEKNIGFRVSGLWFAISEVDNLIYIIAFST